MLPLQQVILPPDVKLESPPLTPPREQDVFMSPLASPSFTSNSTSSVTHTFTTVPLEVKTSSLNSAGSDDAKKVELEFQARLAEESTSIKMKVKLHAQISEDVLPFCFHLKLRKKNSFVSDERSDKHKTADFKDKREQSDNPPETNHSCTAKVCLVKHRYSSHSVYIFTELYPFALKQFLPCMRRLGSFKWTHFHDFSCKTTRTDARAVCQVDSSRLAQVRPTCEASNHQRRDRREHRRRDRNHPHHTRPAARQTNSCAVSVIQKPDALATFRC